MMAGLHTVSLGRGTTVSYTKLDRTFAAWEKTNLESNSLFHGCCLSPPGVMGLFPLRPGIPRAWQNACHREALCKYSPKE